jgi:hypothetical protein
MVNGDAPCVAAVDVKILAGHPAGRGGGRKLEDRHSSQKILTTGSILNYHLGLFR